MIKKIGAATAEPRVPGPPRERRYIYNGSVVPGHAGFVTRLNAKGVRRKVSTFNVILLLFGLGGAIVSYINNILVINKLAAEIGQLETQYGKVNAVRESLRAEIARKSTLEHINAFAQGELKLHQDLRQPEFFVIDRGKLSEMQAATGIARK